MSAWPISHLSNRWQRTKTMPYLQAHHGRIPWQVPACVATNAPPNIASTMTTCKNTSPYDPMIHHYCALTRSQRSNSNIILPHRCPSTLLHVCSLPTVAFIITIAVLLLISLMHVGRVLWGEQRCVCRVQGSFKVLIKRRVRLWFRKS